MSKLTGAAYDELTGGVILQFKLSDFRVSGVTQRHSGEVIDYGVKMSGAPLEWGETMGEGIRIGVIDTGVDLRHEDLRGAIAEARNFVDERKSAQDDNGHGTHICGIIGARYNGIGVVGVAPKCSLYVAKAFDDEGSADFEAIKKSFQWLISRRVHIINMSFSSSTANDEYEQIVKEAFDNNITLVCAAGNDGRAPMGINTIGYPARFPETIAVSAVDPYKRITKFSSQGAQSEICAAGKDIYSTCINNSYIKLSGTSMATPIISGAVALFQGKAYRRYKRFLTPQEIRLLLHFYAEEIGRDGWDKNYGYGIFSFGRLDKSEYINSMVAKNRRR